MERERWQIQEMAVVFDLMKKIVYMHSNGDVVLSPPYAVHCHGDRYEIEDVNDKCSMFLDEKKWHDVCDQVMNILINDVQYQ